MVTLNAYNNAEACVMKFLNLLHMNVDPSVVIDELDKHPDYPSLLAISDILNNFNVENYAFRIDVGELSFLKSITYPFIAHTTINSGDFIVVTAIKDDHLIASSDKWTNHKIKIDEFKKMFAWVVLTGEANASRSATTKKNIFNQIKLPAIGAGLFLIIFLLLYFHTSYFSGFNFWLFFLINS